MALPISYGGQNDSSAAATAGSGVNNTFNIGGNPNLQAIANSPTLQWGLIALAGLGVALLLWRRK